MILGGKLAISDNIPQDADELISIPSMFGEFVVKTSGSDLNLRKCPNTESEIITTIRNGKEVTCYGFTDTSKSWAMIEVVQNGDVYIGFAHVDYLKKS